MKLARKLILGMVFAMTLVLSISAYHRVGAELAIFDEDMTHDHATIMALLRPILVEAWMRGGREEALRTLARVANHDPSLSMDWYDGDPSVGRRSRLELHTTDLPVMVHGQTVGFVEISEARGFLREAVYRTVFSTAAVTLILALVTAVVATILGMWFVGKPVAKLVEKARRIGKGDFGDPLTIHQKDEIGELAMEMNALCVRLSEARDALATESEARIRAVEQLRHADRLATVGKLASGIAHEMGTPLGVALMRANMIATGAKTGEEAKEAARIVGQQIDHITSIVRQLLDFARGRNATAPGQARKRSQVDLAAMAKDTLELLQPMAEKRNVTVKLEVQDEPLAHPPADQEQIQQVLVNLTVNALHASLPGGQVKIVLKNKSAFAPSELTPVPATEEPQTRYVVVMVEDGGIGIAPEVLPRIFEPFFSTKDVGEGTGLGLSVVYGIVRDHGGWIGVESEPGQGSRFSVYLPTEFSDNLA